MGKTKQARYSKINKEKGLCVDCPREVQPGRIRCKLHLDMRARHQREYAEKNRERYKSCRREDYYRRKNECLCVECGHALASHELHATCDDCLELKRMRQ